MGEPYYSNTHLAEIESVAACIQNMSLAGKALGLGTAWLTAPLLVKNRITDFIETNDELLAILTLGFPAERGKKFTRKPLSKTVRYAT